MIKLGEALKEQREINNLSQNKLSKLTGISQKNISGWENEEKAPRLISCIRLADFYGISIDELIGHEIKQNYKK